MIIDHECKILSVDAADMPNLTEQDLRTISNYKLFGELLRYPAAGRRKLLELRRKSGRDPRLRRHAGQDHPAAGG